MKRLFAFLLLAGCAHSLVRSDIHQRGWLLVETAHISLRTDLDRHHARARARWLEVSWRVLAREYEVIATGASPPRRQFAVIFLARCADFDQIRSRMAAAGFTSRIDGEDVAVTCEGHMFFTPEHELTHMFNHHYVGRLPRWLDEGLAVYYETLLPMWGGRVLLGAAPRVAHGVSKYRVPPPSLRALRALSPDEFYDPTHILMNYFCAWKLVHMLSTSDAGRLAGFHLYLAALHAGIPEPAAWQQAFRDLPAGSLDRAYAAYPGRTRPREFTRSYPESRPATRFRALRAGEIHALWASLLQVAHRDAVADQLRAGEKADPDWPGFLYWRAQLLRPPDEVELLRAYVARRPDDAKGRWALVKAQVRRATVVRDGLPLAGREELDDVRGDVRALIEHTSQPQALNTVAWYYALRRQPNIGLNFAMRAVQAEPACADCWDTLGLLYFEAGKVDLAIQAVDRAIGIYAERVPREVRARLSLYRGARQ